MESPELAKLLCDLGACSEAVAFAKGETLHTAWTTCERGDWMLWLCGKMADKKGWPTRKQVVLAACACAETALKHVEAGEDRPRIAIETARKWARGKATLQQVKEAAKAAFLAGYAAAAAADAAAAAADADAAAFFHSEGDGLSPEIFRAYRSATVWIAPRERSVFANCSTPSAGSIRIQ